MTLVENAITTTSPHHSTIFIPKLNFLHFFFPESEPHTATISTLHLVLRIQRADYVI